MCLKQFHSTAKPLHLDKWTTLTNKVLSLQNSTQGETAQAASYYSAKVLQPSPEMKHGVSKCSLPLAFAETW